MKNSFYHRLDVLAEPLFIGSLAVLLINDFWLKSYFHNYITGKLSDFAGIIVFVLFWSAVFPHFKKRIFILTVIFFTLWKLPVSDGFIHFWNQNGFYHIYRVADFSDLAALTTLPFLYFYKPSAGKLFSAAWLRIPLCFLTLFAFCATSYITKIDYQKRYRFPFPLQELVKRVNEIQTDCNKIPFSLDYQNADSVIIRENDTLFVSYNDKITIYYDTLYKYDRILQRATSEIDTVWRYVLRETDTSYIHGYNTVTMEFSAYHLISDSLKKYCDCFSAQIIISGDADTSSLTLKSIDPRGCFHLLNQLFGKKEMKDIVLSAFEREVIRKILHRD